MRFDEELKKRVEGESWEYIAQLGSLFVIEFDTDTKVTRKLKKELSVIKHIICGHLNNGGAERFITPALFVRLVQAILKFEKDFEKHNIRRKEFLVFLRALLHKLKKEKLHASKPLEREMTFKKMKDIMENGNGHL